MWRAIGPSPAPPEQTERRRIVIVGAGPVGLTLALDLAQRGHDVLLLNRLDFVAAGSKAICFAKRSLEIWQRLGIADVMLDKGVVWNIGKVFWGDRPNPLYQFTLLPDKFQRFPAFINLQQYHVESRLIDALADYPNVELRWGHRVEAAEQRQDGARLSVSSLDRDYAIECDWLIACDGFKSTIRSSLGLDFEGRVFEDNFLIADIRMKAGFPSERWFWFDPPFNRGQSALLHKQPDDIWRLDFQLGSDIDREASARPENVEPLIRGLLGPDIAFEKEWYSVYAFQCRRMSRFVHGRIIFAGDSAHVVSPFGARGCNGGLADAENLGWKLDLVLNGQAPEALIESYNDEAILTADENIGHSSRATDFMSPKTAAARALRDAVLDLAGTQEFARRFINSGRLSTAVSYQHSELSTPDGIDEKWAGFAPGTPALDVPVGSGWLYDQREAGFMLIGYQPPEFPGLPMATVDDRDTLAIERYDLEPGSVYLIRPDSYVAARWRSPSSELIAAALDGATGQVAA